MLAKSVEPLLLNNYLIKLNNEVYDSYLRYRNDYLYLAGSFFKFLSGFLMPQAHKRNKSLN